MEEKGGYSYSEDLSTLQVMVSSATTSSIGPGKQAWNWLTSGKLKERLQKLTETILPGTLSCLRNTSHQNQML